MAGDANHAREVAQQELSRVKSGYEEERRRREMELRERHQVRSRHGQGTHTSDLLLHTKLWVSSGGGP
jgi:hypothetical protein